MAVDLTPDETTVLNEVREKWEQCEGPHRSYENQWSRLFRLYRSYRQFDDAYRSASLPGRDDLLVDAQEEWGAELFIPYSFSTVETILPRMLSNRPRMLVLPRNPDSEQNVPKMRALIDAQQERIRYELKLQKVAKSGLIYGLGVQKVFWRNEVRKRRQLEKGTSEPLIVTNENRTLFDDPDVGHVDIFDFLWDPYACELDQCRYLFHRTWRDTRYVMDKCASGDWRHLDEDDVKSLGPTGKYDETHQDRMTAAGHRDWKARGDQMHEVWEFHDRERIITVLDRQVPVQIADSEDLYWHCEYPFVTFRPTESGMEQLPGIGEIEPIEDLQREMNTLRRQRRDNAALKLAQVFAYAEGFIDQGDLQFFPGAAIPVQAGEPRDMLFPINVGDIPNSGYQEEANLQADIERTTGISDPVSGAGDASQTATGVQLVQAAANVRIQQKTRRLEVETVKPTTRMFGGMNQQKILTSRQVRLPGDPMPGDPEKRWTWVELGPEELMGEFDYEPEGGSTAPENVPQMRQDGQLFMQLFSGDPNVDQTMVKEHGLTLFGIKNPQQWLRPDGLGRLPDALVQMGLDPTVVQKAMMLAQQLEQQPEAPQGPTGSSQASRNGSEPDQGQQPQDQPAPTGG